VWLFVAQTCPQSIKSSPRPQGLTLRRGNFENLSGSNRGLVRGPGPSPGDPVSDHGAVRRVAGVRHPLPTLFDAIGSQEASSRLQVGGVNLGQGGGSRGRGRWLEHGLSHQPGNVVRSERQGGQRPRNTNVPRTNVRHDNVGKPNRTRGSKPASMGPESKEGVVRANPRCNSE
jgi:hypothetical protein